MTEPERIIFDTLDSWGIEYKTYHHEAKFTVEEKEELDRELGITARHCKNIFLTNRQKTSFYLLVMPFEKTFRTAEVSKELGSSRLSFAPNELLNEMLSCNSGCLSTLSLIFDKENTIKLAIDKDLLACDELCCHPNIDTTTVTIKTEDYMTKLLSKLCKTPELVTVSDKGE